MFGKEKLKKSLLNLLDLIRLQKNACPLNIQIESEEQKDGYKQIRFVFESEWGALVPCYLLIPDTGKKKYPVAITLQGHSTGFHNSVGMLYAFQNVFDFTFYGLGKTNYMLFESVVTNTIYYGTAFILYLCSVWTPSLIGIALLFGIGNAFDGIVSLVAYAFLLKKKKINILDIE